MNCSTNCDPLPREEVYRESARVKKAINTKCNTINAASVAIIISFENEEMERTAQLKMGNGAGK